MEPCIDPTAVTPEQLGAYAADPSDAPPELVQHLAGCPACQTEVAELRSFTTMLRGQLYRIDCPPSADLTALVAGTLAPTQRAATAAHISACARCREEVALVTAALTDHDPILDWTVPTAPGSLRRVLATLLDALAPGMAAPAPALHLRSAGASSATRPHLYHAEDATVVLRVSPTQQGNVMVEGIVSSATDPTLALAELPIRLYTIVADATPRLVAEDTTDAGMFELGPLPTGHYELEVHLPDRIIVVEDLAW